MRPNKQPRIKIRVACHCTYIIISMVAFKLLSYLFYFALIMYVIFICGWYANQFDVTFPGDKGSLAALMLVFTYRIQTGVYCVSIVYERGI